MGFQPSTCDRPRRVARTAFDRSELLCSLRRTPGGGCLAEALVHGEALSRPAGRDGLAHTVRRTRSVLLGSKIVCRFSNALIPGDLERGRFAGGIHHLGGTPANQSVPSFGSLPGCSTRGRPTAAPTSRRVRPRCSIGHNTPMKSKPTADVRKAVSRKKVQTDNRDPLLPRLKAGVSALWYL
jgi:hypothetical protein